MTANEPERTRPDSATREAESRDSEASHEADRMPTEEEELRAPEESGPGVADNYKEMTERGAGQQGEGRIP